MRLIDADAFLAENCADRLFYDPEYEIGVASCDECNCHCLEIDCDRIMDAPTIDAVPVVRCKDCRWSDTYPDMSAATMPLKCLGTRYGGVYPDWYCEHGERKEEE